MKRLHVCCAFGLLTISFLASSGTTQESILSKNPALFQRDSTEVGQRDSAEVLTRGPLHEAFIQPIEQQPVPNDKIGKEPPPPIPENPPAEKPDVDNAQWIPGYWAWDAEKQDFLWVSGVYRVPPQGRSFVPGYWSQAGDGWRWVAGFWSNAEQQETPYAPEPPAPLDEPNLQPPSDDGIYIPGSWIFVDGRFIWRAGYYARAQPGRVWVPSHYVWTPNGYLYVNGYWDVPYDARGIAYAPMYFSQPLWNDPSWSYQPSYIVPYNSFLNSAFIFGNGFYFGNYYGPNYARLGYRPWYQGRGRYDPAFAYYGWRNYRGDRNWVGGQQNLYAQRAAGQVAAPPLTFAQQGKTPVVARSGNFTPNNFKIVQANATQTAANREAVQNTRQLAASRQQLEASQQPARTLRVSGSTISGLTPTQPQFVTPQARTITPTTQTPRANTPAPTIDGAKLNTPTQPSTIINNTPKLNAPTQPSTNNNNNNNNNNNTPKFNAPTQPSTIINTPRAAIPTPPVNNTPKAIIPTPPVINTPRAIVPTPPVINTPKAIVPTPPVINTPRAIVPTPPIINTPKAIVPTPPVINTPKAIIPTPAPTPRINTPAPNISAPRPAAIQPPPAPRINTPVPNINASKPAFQPPPTVNRSAPPTVNRTPPPTVNRSAPPPTVNRGPAPSGGKRK